MQLATQTLEIPTISFKLAPGQDDAWVEDALQAQVKKLILEANRRYGGQRLTFCLDHTIEPAENGHHMLIYQLQIMR